MNKQIRTLMMILIFYEWCSSFSVLNISLPFYFGQHSSHYKLVHFLVNFLITTPVYVHIYWGFGIWIRQNYNANYHIQWFVVVAMYTSATYNIHDLESIKYFNILIYMPSWYSLQTKHTSQLTCLLNNWLNQLTQKQHSLENSLKLPYQCPASHWIQSTNYFRVY